MVAIEPGVDRLSRARAIVKRSGLNVQLSGRSLFDLTTDSAGSFDVVLFLGLLYHLDNPIGALARVFELTGDLCVLETQVARPVQGLHCDWGTGAPRNGPAIAVVPADESHVETRALALVPTYDALIALLRGAGFDSIELVPPEPHMHHQFVTHDRVVVIARKRVESVGSLRCSAEQEGSLTVCNSECISFVERAVELEDVKGKDVIEVGSYDVNGSVRPYVESLAPASYLGVDIRQGPGVDLICPAELLADRFGEESFDLVVSTELLEHVADWRIVITNVKRIVRAGGLIVITTRSRGFELHDFPDDFWRYEPSDMRVIFADCCIEMLDIDRSAPGVFVAARRPTTERFEPLDLSGYALHIAGTDVRSLDPVAGAVGPTADPHQPSDHLEITALTQALGDKRAEVEGLLADLTVHRAEAQRLADELARLRSTRTFRYTSPVRRMYGALVARREH